MTRDRRVATIDRRHKTRHDRRCADDHVQRAVNMPLLVMNLTDAEYDAFHDAQIPYSGATGKIREGYEGHSPYIATFIDQLPKILVILEWHDAHLTRRSGQVWLRKIKK